MTTWQPGIAPVAVVMISLNEGHNMEAVLENLRGWAQEVFLVDSYSHWIVKGRDVPEFVRID